MGSYVSTDTDGFKINPEDILKVVYAIFPVIRENGALSVVTVANGNYEARWRGFVDFSRFAKTVSSPAGKLLVSGKVNSGNADIRVFNESDGVELAVINFTETDFTLKTAAFANVAALTGYKKITLEMRRNMPGTIFSIDLASVEIMSQGS